MNDAIRTTENEKRLHRRCFTGHRPEKLSWSEKEVIAWLDAEIRKAIGDGFVTFIPGMARVVDIWAAEIVLRLRDEGKPIQLICASPFEGFERSWSEDCKQRYIAVMRQADIVKCVCQGYSRSCFQIRNEWMVDRSARVIAVYNGEAGGTRNTLKYAHNHSKEIMSIQQVDAH